MVGEHAERVARLHVLPLGRFQLLDLQESRAVGPGRLVLLLRHAHGEFAEQRPFRCDLIHLARREAVQEEPLSPGAKRRFELLLLVAAIEDDFARNRPIGGNRLQSGNLPPQDVQILGRSQELGLGLDHLLVREPQFHQRLAGRHGLPGKRPDPRYHARERGCHLHRGPARPLDDHGRHGDRPLERAEFHLGQPHSHGFLGRLAQFQRARLIVLVVRRLGLAGGGLLMGMLVAAMGAGRLAFVFVLLVAVLALVGGIAGIMIVGVAGATGGRGLVGAAGDGNHPPPDFRQPPTAKDQPGGNDGQEGQQPPSAGAAKPAFCESKSHRPALVEEG